MNNTSSAASATRIVVAAGEAASIEAPAGAAIRCVEGRLWLTQEDDARDHIVPAGTTFCTDRAGRVVVSGVDETAVVVVSEAAPAYCVRGAVRIDSVEAFVRAAHAARSDYVAGVFARLCDRLARLFQRKVVRSSDAACAPDERQRFRGYVRSL